MGLGSLLDDGHVILCTSLYEPWPWAYQHLCLLVRRQLISTQGNEHNSSDEKLNKRQVPSTPQRISFTAIYN